MLYKVKLMNNALVDRHFKSLESAVSYAGETSYVFQTKAKIFRRENDTSEWEHFIPEHFTEGIIFV